MCRGNDVWHIHAACRGKTSSIRGMLHGADAGDRAAAAAADAETTVGTSDGSDVWQKGEADDVASGREAICSPDESFDETGVSGNEALCSTEGAKRTS